ncbi:hypothetical protein PABG_00573 [Paracoccidioides brasiliensis Pb03]|nr:hypothetical protein PABG_00573 [Paracoccidioides brasiliensis Pb03]
MASNLDIPDEAPPPYNPIDPLTPASSNESATTADAAEPPFDDNNNDIQIPSYGSLLPPNFISAVPYFRERAPSLPHQVESLEPVLEHMLTIYPRSQSKDFQRFPKCLRPRSTEITQHDWNTFLNYLFPTHLAPAGSQPHLPRKLRAEIERDRKDCAQEGDDGRQARIYAVVSEWNQCFFAPRSARILCVYVSSTGSPPPTHLCPKCYPSTVRSLPVRSGPSMDGSSLVRTETAPEFPAQNSNPRCPAAAHSNGNSVLAPEVSIVTAQGSTSIPYPTQYRNRGMAGHSAYDSKSAPSFGMTGAIVNWATQFGERAEQYGQWVGEQATAHGKRVEECSQMYGRVVEEQAKAKGEFIEKQAKWLGSMGGGLGFHRTHPWGSFANKDHHHGFPHSDPSARHNPSQFDHCCTHGFAGYGHPWVEWESRRQNRHIGQLQLQHQRQRQRQRTASVSSTLSSSSSSSSPSSSSSSSSSSSDSDSSFPPSLSSSSDRHAAGLAEFREKIRSIQRKHEQSQNSALMVAQSPDVNSLRQELRMLRTAYKQFRDCKKRSHGSNVHKFPPWTAARNSGNSSTGDMKTKEAQAVLKQNLQNTKKEFRALVSQIRNEKKEILRQRRQRRKEARREKKKQRKKNGGKGKCKS